MPLLRTTLKVWLKNLSAAPVIIDELGGHSLAPGAEVDPCDAGLPVHYTDPRAVLRAADELTGTTIYAGTHADPPTLQCRTERV